MVGHVKSLRIVPLLSPSHNAMDDSGSGGCQENGTSLTALYQVSLKRHYDMGCFSEVGLSTLVLVKANHWNHLATSLHHKRI